MLRALARRHRSESDPAVAQSPCPCRVWHQHKLSACPLKLHLEEIKRDVLAPFSPSKHPGNGERSVRVFPSLRLSFSACLAQAALANPVYFFIFHSWWCSRSTNCCHGKWAVVEACGDLRPLADCASRESKGAMLSIFKGTTKHTAWDESIHRGLLSEKCSSVWWILVLLCFSRPLQFPVFKSGVKEIYYLCLNISSKSTFCNAGLHLASPPGF